MTPLGLLQTLFTTLTAATLSPSNNSVMVQQRGTSTHLEKQFLAYAKANLLDETNSADNNNKSEDSVLAANELGSFDWSGALNYASKTKQAAKTNKQTYSSSSSTSSSSEEEEL